ncbi:myrosinase 1-like [Episyrphus balteatus]|uniref:myrosinase 1-like n=1 Tax=Episyrphus balteatus TaxID=286459 RepID=UPI002485C139|nr:myrosinase 1-like [Episyrphus balteatus]
MRMWFKIIIFAYGFLVESGYADELDTCSLAAKGSPHFPANFSFGVATAAFQIEGGWNEDGKGPSVWDDFVHDHPQLIDDRTNGDVAVDSYHRFDQDLAALKELKVNFYRFSISWARIFPTGDVSSKNQKGIDYYNEIIDKLIANGIQPMVTMFHYDLPAEVQKNGGFLNSKIINQFASYAKELYKLFGDRVKTWVTLNQPLLYCRSSYGYGFYPPQYLNAGVDDYICMENSLKAHAVAYHTYRTQFYKKQRGKIGMAILSKFFYSKTNEQDAIELGLQFALGFQAHPLFAKSGGYPEVVASNIAKNSLKEGFNKTRLPMFDEKWRKLIKGSADFLGLNYYTSAFITRAKDKSKVLKPSWENDRDCDESVDPNWKIAKSPWLLCVPQGLEGLLKYIRDEYNNVEVIILENGWSDEENVEDNGRISFIKSHLQAILNAINDGCNVTGYTYWSLIDAFEWVRGFTTRFGLFSVDLSSENKKRSPRKSAGFYRNVIETKMIPDKI